MPALVVGSRGSDLALAQTNFVIQSLRANNDNLEFSQKVITTRGDKGVALSSTETGKDAFTREIDLALLKGEIDLAVHSLKDLPSEEGSNSRSPRVELAAFPERDSPFDVLISKKGGTIGSLSKGARIGTSSVRRSIQLKSYRPDFTIVEVHGNVSTRIRKLRKGDFDLDALVLAEAGFNRLGISSEIDEVISQKIILPAVGQGALAIAVRSNDATTKRIVRSIDDLKTRQCVTAERRFSVEFGGGCNTPLAALATLDGGMMKIEGMVSRIKDEYKLGEGGPIVRKLIIGSSKSPKQLGRKLAAVFKNSKGVRQ